jgi:threonine/homoserine/homoserine lactone efflux protein
VKMILEARAVESPLETANVTSRNPFWQGIATEALNPKTALFFFRSSPNSSTMTPETFLRSS